MSGASLGFVGTEPRTYMQVACPYCQTKMIVNVGSTTETSKNSVQCLGCHKTFVAIVPGPVVGGPFTLSD
jgi:DNA-directed RNA polymerase subunit RPC12/RpoP